jgi:hypothetical protein
LNQIENLVSVTAYHFFGGEIEASNTPHDTPPYPLMPSPTIANSSRIKSGWMELLIALGTTILGVVLSQIASHWESWYQTASRSDLRGEWLALDFFDEKDFFVEKITISRKYGKLYIKNHGNKVGQMFEAYCTVEEPGVLTGTWRSLRPGATVKGRILLFINPHATSLSGVYSGKSDDGRDFLFCWILARDEESLRKAAVSLNTTLPIKHHTYHGDAGSK